MADITLSKAVRSNLLNLQSTATQLGKTQERLATGLKVNSALDNPTNFFTASSLNSRAGDLGNLLDSISNATQTLEAADNGITAITSLVESAQAAARQAKQVSATIDSTSTSVTAVATSGAGSVDVRNDTAATVTASTTFTNDTAAAGTGSVDLGSTPGSTLLSTLGVSDEDIFTFTIGSNTLTIGVNNTNAGGTFSGSADSTIGLDFASATISDFVTALDGVLSDSTATSVDTGFANFSASIDANNNLVISSGDTSVNFTTAETAGTTLSTSFGIANQAYTATSSTLSTLSAAGATLDIAAGAASDTLDFTGITTVAQFDSAVSALSVAGLTIASSGGNLSITANDNATSFSVADGTNTGAAAALGVTEQTYDPSSTTLAGLSGTLSITVGTATPVTVDLSTVNSEADLTSALSGLTGATASIDGSTGFLSITAAANSAESIVVSGSTGFGLTDGTFTATTASTTTQIANPARESFVTQYNDLMSQIDDLVTDASFNGVNLLNGDTLQVQFNEDGSSKLDITGVTFDASGLGLSTVATGGFDTNAAIDTVLDTLGTAVNSLRSQASTFGSNLSVVEIRNDFTKEMINTLETGASNLTLADSNEEAANLLALQTRQQLSSTALSLASQSDQNVLRLF